MKKNFFITGLTLALICNCRALWASPDFFGNYSHYFSYEKKTFTTGVKIDLSLAEGRFSIDNKGNYNYGLSVFTDNYLRYFPIKCQVGNLSSAGIISKLNNPETDTSTSCFGSCYSSPAIITSSLPSYTSFSKPFSTFMEAGWKNENTFVREVTLNGAYVPELKDLSFSSKLKFGFYDAAALTNSFGFSLFTLKEKNNSSWYLDIPYYRESGTFCFADQVELKLFNFLTNFSIFCYKSPFPDRKKIIENIYRTENKFETDHFKISVSAFFNNNRNIISRENKVLHPCTQIKTNIQYNTEFGGNDDYGIKTGITAYGNIYAEQNQENDFKFGAGTTFYFPLASVSAEGNFSYKYSETARKMILRFFSADIENFWDFRFFSPSIGINSQYYISSKNYNISKIYRINLGFNFWDGTIINNNNISFSVKDNKIYNKKLKTGITFNFSYKKLLISAKIAGEFCI